MAPRPKRQAPPVVRNARSGHRYLSTNIRYAITLLSGRDIHPSRARARASLSQTAKRYTTSRPPIAGDDPDQVTLWIRGLMTPLEAQRGYRGNYARLSVVPRPDGRWMVRVKKLEIPLGSHPERSRPRQDQPDWGLKALRLAEGHPQGGQAAEFETWAVADEKLRQLHHEYPRSRYVPGTLDLRVYKRQDGKCRSHFDQAPD